MNTVMELEIGPGPEAGSYVVHVLRSVGGGEPSQAITLDLDELVDGRPLLEATVLSSSVSARRVMSDTEAVVQEVGHRLFESTFSGAVRTAYRTSMAVASERGTGVQIALRLTAPGLAALPWETLFDAETGAYLCRKEPLVRYVPAPHAAAALAIEPPMRVLGMISSPRGLPALDVDGERERLEQALRPHLDSGRVELEWLDEVSWTGVHGKLLEGQWHVLHFVGHGTYDVDTDEGVLAFVGRDGRADYVTASSLADLLDEAEPTPRLVVLNSCQSGAGGTTDLFSGTAAALAHSGIRAVAAMQFSISDTAAIEFARGFYTALSHGRGIDEAVRSGRIGILGMGRGTLEWVTPVLYLRGEDTQLFDVAPLSTAELEAPKDSAVEVPVAPPGRAADAAPPTPADGTATSTPTPALTAPVAARAPEPVDSPSTSTSRPVATSAPAAESTGSKPPGTPTAPPPRHPAPAPAPRGSTSSGARSEAPWWTAPPARRPPPVAPTVSSPAGRPSGVGSSTGTPTARPPNSGPPNSGPPNRPHASPGAHPASTRRWTPWLVVGVVSIAAIVGAIGAVTLLRPDSGLGGTPIGEFVGAPDPVRDDARTPDEADAGVLVTEKVVPLDYEDFVYTEYVCQPDAEYRITATSEGATHDGTPVGPNGIGDGAGAESPPYAYALASLLVGVRGSDAMEFVGSDGAYTCQSSAEMKLTVNDVVNLERNSGHFRVRISQVSGG
ncbi:CHAT domain-containing protein [Agromyces ramosus]|uniref:CHAT domain-containing protein n=1 Tax=Agromyces ramosus TaxID=33879 RepID=A0A4Q7MKJ4_9MICO|nr:CHAT domain-containing protein [Agromyces ramosus]RZS68806.1 CHAT domain-containing protein [Agromyces ramosus]